MSVEFTDNSRAVLSALEAAKKRALEEIGLAWVQYSSLLCPVGTEESTGKKGYPGGTLRQSIDHNVNGDTLSVGSPIPYAPYVELGTGPFFEPPPEWEQFESERGRGVGRAYVKPRPYIRPGLEDHVDEYKRIAEDTLRG